MTTPQPQTTSAPAPSLLARFADVRTQTLLTIVVLLVQLLLGLANTFWLQVPESGSAWQDNQPGWLLAVHMTVGMLVAVLAIGVLVHARKTGDAVWLGCSVVGLLGIVVGFVGGTVFMSQVTNDAASYLMAVGCVVAIGAYVWALYHAALAQA